MGVCLVEVDLVRGFLLLVCALLQQPNTMADFKVDNFFLRSFDRCVDCPKPNQDHKTDNYYHCLVCHKNLTAPKNASELNSYLKKHYKRSRGHRLDEPPRDHQPKDYEDLYENDQLTVATGISGDAFCTGE